MRPDFIGIGAQKAGTSWIYACLDDHPDIHVPIKEIHFFSKDDVHARGLDWYERNFAGRKEGQVSGEFSTTYLHSRPALERIAKAFPDIKIIVSLRDPIARAKSHFGNDLKAGLIPRDAELADIFDSRPDYVERGFYADSIGWLFDNFGRHRVLVLVLEDSYEDPEAFVAGIYRFLGVDENFRPRALHQRINVSEVPRSLALGRFYDRVSAALRAAGLGAILRFLRHVGVIEFLRGLNRARKGGTEGIAASGADRVPEWKPELVARLEEDRRALEKLLGRGLDFWTSRQLAEKMNS